MKTATDSRIKPVPAPLQTKPNPSETHDSPNPGKEFREQFREECLIGSGIDPDLFECAIQFLVDVQQTDGGDAYLPIHEALGWNQETLAYFFINP